MTMNRIIIAATAAAILSSVGVAGQASADTYGPFGNVEECVEGNDRARLNAGTEGGDQQGEEGTNPLNDGNKGLDPGGYTEYRSEDNDGIVNTGICYQDDYGDWYFTL
ncbi:hypothetical protein [Nocardia wallacei]|uniref:hypothetical protein n=1 Tax=Nocardia wallacei TaxID=480035 RepID=UPI00245614F3|nr:hypothetical protein [Nocardia wallacei]